MGPVGWSMLTPEPIGADPEIWAIELLEERVMQTDATSSVAAQTQAGSVVALWRYPVKSMMGEELNSSEVTDRGHARGPAVRDCGPSHRQGRRSQESQEVGQLLRLSGELCRGTETRRTDFPGSDHPSRR